MHPFCCEWGRPVAECNFMFTWNYWYTNRDFLLIHNFPLIQICRIQKGNQRGPSSVPVCSICYRKMLRYLNNPHPVRLHSMCGDGGIFQIPPRWYYCVLWWNFTSGVNFIDPQGQNFCHKRKWNKQFLLVLCEQHEICLYSFKTALCSYTW